MTLRQDLEEWREKLNNLLDEYDQIYERIGDLEKQNILLQERLVKGEYQTGGFDALRKLYDEGFHICPASFGQQRDDECLFCLTFLLHKGKKDVE